MVRGFAAHDPAITIAGVIVNRAATDRHRLYVADAIAATGIPVLGALGRGEAFALPSRHLGLVQAGEHGDLDMRLDRIADEIERGVDLDALLSLAGELPGLAPGNSPALPPPGNRIALARDDAFSFVYPHVLAGWHAAGAAIVPFSPLADEPPPEDCDCCWLPGGYPELHAGRIAAASAFRDGLRNFARTRPVHGECGGYMVLGEGLEDADGKLHAMAGLLGHSTSFAKRRLTLGYREARVAADAAIFPGATVRGHEFHYATVTDARPTRRSPSSATARAGASAPPEGGGGWCQAPSSTRLRRCEADASSRPLYLVGANEKIGRDLPRLADLVDHFDGEGAPTRQNFGGAGARAEKLGQLGLRMAEFVDGVLEHVDGIEASVDRRPASASLHTARPARPAPRVRLLPPTPPVRPISLRFRRAPPDGPRRSELAGYALTARQNTVHIAGGDRNAHSSRSSEADRESNASDRIARRHRQSANQRAMASSGLSAGDLATRALAECSTSTSAWCSRAQTGMRSSMH